MSQGVALVTGASSGIGAVYADRLAHRGHDLILVARDQARLASLAQRLRATTGVRIEVLRADLTDPQDLAAVQSTTLSEPALTMLVNNAGVALSGDLLAVSPAEIEDLIVLNVTAPTLLATAAVRAMVPRGKGAIVNVSSITALAPEKSEPSYGASKAFVLHLTQGLAARFSETGLRFQAVLPGAARTEIWERSGLDLSAFPNDMVMDAGDVVDAALAGFDSGELVTLPALPDDAQWRAMDAARLAMAPNLSRREVASRYRQTAAPERHKDLVTTEGGEHAL